MKISLFVIPAFVILPLIAGTETSKRIKCQTCHNERQPVFADNAGYFFLTGQPAQKEYIVQVGPPVMAKK